MEAWRLHFPMDSASCHRDNRMQQGKSPIFDCSAPGVSTTKGGDDLKNNRTSKEEFKITIAVDKKLHDAIDKLARKQKVTTARIVYDAVEFCVEAALKKEDV